MRHQDDDLAALFATLDLPVPAEPPPQDHLLLRSTGHMPDIRAKLHSICALYAHAPTLDQRLALLDRLEILALNTAQTLAVELLECGWQPAPSSGSNPIPKVA